MYLPITRFFVRSWNRQWPRKKDISLKVLVSLQTEFQLKANFGRLNIDDRVIDEVGFTVPDPRLLQVDPSAMVTIKGVLCDRKLEKILE